MLCFLRRWLCIWLDILKIACSKRIIFLLTQLLKSILKLIEIFRVLVVKFKYFAVFLKVVLFNSLQLILVLQQEWEIYHELFKDGHKAILLRITLHQQVLNLLIVLGDPIQMVSQLAFFFILFFDIYQMTKFNIVFLFAWKFYSTFFQLRNCFLQPCFLILILLINFLYQFQQQLKALNALLFVWIFVYLNEQFLSSFFLW